MKGEKKKLILAVFGLAAVLIVGQIIACLFPNLQQTSPLAGVVLFIILFIPMAASMAYLTGTLMRFVVEKIVNYEDRQKELHLPQRQRISRNVLVWFILACGFGGLLGSFNLPTFWALLQRGVSTQGQVIKAKKEGPVHYKFRVGEKVYTHSSLTSSPEELKPGAQVSVLYDPQNPQVSILGPVKPRLDNELITIAMVVLTFPAMLMVMFKRVLLPAWKGSLLNQGTRWTKVGLIGSVVGLSGALIGGVVIIVLLILPIATLPPDKRQSPEIYTNIFLNRLQAKNFSQAHAMLHPDYAKEVSQQQLSSAWNRISTKANPVAGWKLTEQRNVKAQGQWIAEVSYQLNGKHQQQSINFEVATRPVVGTCIIGIDFIVAQ